MPQTIVNWILVLGLSTAVGFVTVAPVGPVNLLCARRTLRHGGWPGFSASLGAVAGEAVHAAIAVKGLSLAPTLLQAHGDMLRQIAGLALLVAAVVSWRSSDSISESAEAGGRASPSGPRLGPAVAAAFTLAVSNPAQFVTMGIGLAAVRHATHSSPPPWLEFAGLVFGSLLWWIVLTSMLARARRRLGAESLRRVNLGIAGALAAIGVALLMGWPLPTQPS